MADNVLINTGTGPTIATDQVGTAHYQVIKIAVGAVDTASLLAYGPQNMTNSIPVVIATDQATVTVSVVGTPVVTASQGGTWNIATVSTLLGTVSANVVAFTPGGTQNVAVVNAPVVTASQGGTWNVATLTTLLGTIAISGTASSIPTGTQDVSLVNTPVVTASQGGTWNVATVTTLLGTIAISGTASSIPTGTQDVSLVNTPVVTASQGGTWNVATVSTLLGTIAISGTATIIPSGTQSVSVVNAPVVTATVSNSVLMISGSGLLLGATTGVVGAFVATAHASRFNGYAVSTTSGAAAVLVTSGAHTIYVTDLLFSVDVPMNIDVRSATTAKATVYLATKGGFVFPTRTPIVMNSAESLTFQPSASGSCAGYAAGYTVT